jgi:small subunit ribosomal protein S19e
MSVYDVEAKQLIEKTAEELKKIEELRPPEWVHFVKSGSHAERPPQQEDFWYIRCASLLRYLYINGPIGVSRLRHKYGGRKSKGVAPHKHRKAGGNIIRKALQKLEKVGFVKTTKKGRELTPKGKAFLDKISVGIKKLKAS